MLNRRIWVVALVALLLMSSLAGCAMGDVSAPDREVPISVDAALEGQKTAQKINLLVAPFLDLHKIIRARHHPAQDHQKNLFQRVQHLPRLPRILTRREKVQDIQVVHKSLLPKPPMNHISATSGIPHTQLFKRLP